MRYTDFKSYEELVRYINQDDTFNYNITKIQATGDVLHKLVYNTPDYTTESHHLHIHALFINTLLSTYSKNSSMYWLYTSPDYSSSRTKVENHNIVVTDDITLLCTKLDNSSFPKKACNAVAVISAVAPNVELNQMSVSMFEKWAEKNRVTGGVGTKILESFSNESSNTDLYNRVASVLWSKSPTKQLHSIIGSTGIYFNLLNNTPAYSELAEHLHLSKYAYNAMNRELGYLFLINTESSSYDIYPNLKVKKLSEHEWHDNYNKYLVLELYLVKHPTKLTQLTEQLNKLKFELNKEVYKDFLIARKRNLSLLTGITND